MSNYASMSAPLLSQIEASQYGSSANKAATIMERSPLIKNVNILFYLIEIFAFCNQLNLSLKKKVLQNLLSTIIIKQKKKHF